MSDDPDKPLRVKCSNPQCGRVFTASPINRIARFTEKIGDILIFKCPHCKAETKVVEK